MAIAVRYDIVDMDPRSHEFSMRMTISSTDIVPLRVTLPAWIPGSYMIRDFAKNITTLKATDATGPIELVQRDKQTWEVERWDEQLHFDYRVYAFDLSVRSAFLDDKRGFFNGTSLFLRPHVDVDEWVVNISRPTHPRTSEWRVWTTLPAIEIDAGGFGTYAAADYAQLIDHPVEIGQPLAASFAVRGVPHRLIVSEGGSFDSSRICSDLSKICAEHVAMFGDLPVQQYAFLTLATADGYGGLEHRDSTSLICKRTDLPSTSLKAANKAYRGFLGLCSHEYFHLWNVKRIRPECFGRDPNLQSEVHTELLWAFEGITSYYDDLALSRSGVISGPDYLGELAGAVTRVMRGPGRHRQSVAASSFDAWTKFYKQDENAPNAIVSYYAKGALIAFGLDVTLRLQSADRVSLDDLMRQLWQRFGKTGEGIPERGIEHEVERLLGMSLQSFFDDYVYGTRALPLVEWFGALGIGFRLRHAVRSDDMGGYIVQPADEMTQLPYLGARVDSGTTTLRITHVFTDGPAQVAGLAPGDEVVAINGEKATQSGWQEIIGSIDGATVPLHYFRRGLLYETSLPVQRPPADTCDLWWLSKADTDPAATDRREAWLRSSQSDPV